MFTVGGEDTGLTSYQFNTTGDTSLNILAPGKEDCELSVVAVGGGGSHSYLGGGSGRVASTTMTVSTSQLVVRVGGPRQLSSLETSEGQAIITAQPGEDGFSQDGGAGYSGGGGGGSDSSYQGGDGGQDGGDGEDGSCNGCPGGTGSDLDLSAIKLTRFSLTPGLGGTKNAHYGGGGGGVMVDGEGPQYSVHDGQGYGGGGAHLGTPGSGLVLLEIKPKTNKLLSFLVNLFNV